MRKRGPQTAEGRKRALANLIPFRQDAVGWKRDMHGAHAIGAAQPATQVMVEQLIAVLEGEPAAFLRPIDRTAVELLAVLLRRIRQAEAYLDRNGLTNGRGQVRPVANLLAGWTREAKALCDSLGMTPAGRAKLGLDTGKAFDLARALARDENEEARADGENQS